MNVMLNGASHEIAKGEKLSALIAQLALGGKRLAVEINGEIVPRSQYDVTELAAGDQIEVVQAIGGG